MHSFAWLIAELPKFGPRNIAGLIWRVHVNLRGVTIAECGPRNNAGLILRFRVHHRGVIGQCVETCTLSQASRPLPFNIHRPLPAYKQQAGAAEQVEHGNSLKFLKMFIKSVQKQIYIFAESSICSLK